MKQTIAQQFLQKLFEKQGIHLDHHEGWLMTDRRLPAIKATWHSGVNEITGRLDIIIVLSDKRHVEESFAGIGEGKTGLKDAFRSFMLNSFHVMLAAFWDAIDYKHINVEEWGIAGHRWIAYIGNFGTRTWADEPVPIPADAFDDLEAAIKREPLRDECHWFRAFYSNVGNGQIVIEALFDNREWRGGRRALAAISWPTRNAYYSARVFVVLKKIH